MKGLWQKVKEIWWIFWEVDVNDKTEERLSSSDRRWLLYWNFITCMGVAALFLIVTGINNIRVTRQNGRDVEKAMSMIATYMASATKDEYDDIAQSIRHVLIFTEYGKDIENFIQYIPNTAETCHTCMKSYPAQALLVGPLAVEPPRIPVDPADMEVQPQLGELLHKAVVDLPPQLHGGLVEVLHIRLLVGGKPGPVVVEADAPQEVQRFAAVSGKHILLPFFSCFCYHTAAGPGVSSA